MVTIATKSLVSAAVILARHGELLHRSHRYRAVAKKSDDARPSDAVSSQIAHPDGLLTTDQFTRYEDRTRNGGPDGTRIRGTPAHLAVTEAAPLTSLSFIPDGRPSTELTTWNR